MSQVTRRQLIILSPKDNVATALNDIRAGSDTTVHLGEEKRRVKALERILFGFKMEIVDIAQGDHIIKFGETIGIASSPIKKGGLVHIHNLIGTRGRGDVSKRNAR